MPDRNDEIKQNPLLAKQACSMCFQAYCQLYWGCRNLACRKCLTRFGEMKVTNEFFNTIINDNKYESELFSDWAVRENKTLKEIFDECIEEVRFGKFKAGLVNAKDTLNRVICRDCGLGVFRELAYQYRLNIPSDKFFSKSIDIF